MRTDADHRPSPPPSTDPIDPVEAVDLDDPVAVRRAVAAHQAGRAVFSVPFNAAGGGTLTWLDPHHRG